MGLISDEDSDSLSDGSLKLLVKLVDTDSVDEVSNIIVGGLASKDYSNVECNEDIIVSWASVYRELEENVLWSNQELNLGPWKADNKSSALLDVIELTMLGNDSITSFGPKIKISIKFENLHINVWHAGGSLWNKDDWCLSRSGIVTEPLKQN